MPKKKTMYKVVVRTPHEEKALITTARRGEAAKVYNAHFGRTRLVINGRDVPICAADKMMGGRGRERGQSTYIEPKKAVETHNIHQLKSAQ